MSELISVRRISKYQRNNCMKQQRLILTQREYQVLNSLYYHKCLTTRQIAKIHYQYHPVTHQLNRSAEQIARRRIRKLFNGQYLDRFYIDVGTGGTSQGYNVLTKQGALLLADYLKIPFRKLSWKYEMTTTRLPYLEHLVKINECYISFLKQSRTHPTHEVGEFYTENHCRYAFKFWGNNVVCNPDAYGQYFFSEEEGFHYFLEVDNGTMSIPTFQKKQPRYAAFYASKTYQQYFEEFPIILVVTTSEERAYRLMKCIATIDCTDLQWYFTSEQAFMENPLGAIWICQQKEELCTLI